MLMIKTFTTKSVQMKIKIVNTCRYEWEWESVLCLGESGLLTAFWSPKDYTKQKCLNSNILLRPVSRVDIIKSKYGF